MITPPSCPPLGYGSLLSNRQKVVALFRKTFPLSHLLLLIPLTAPSKTTPQSNLPLQSFSSLEQLNHQRLLAVTAPSQIMTGAKS